jgi:hypothetical protein
MQAENRFAGKRVRCRKCGQPVQVPGGDVAAADPYVDDPYVAEPAPVAARPRKKAKRVRRSSEPAANSGTLRSWGITLSLLGIGSFILPYLGIQFKLVNFFGPAQSIVAGLLGVAGAVLLFASLMHKPLAGVAAAGSVLFLLLVVFAAHLLWDPNAPAGPPQGGGGGNVAGPAPILEQHGGTPPPEQIVALAVPPSGRSPAEAGRPTELLGGNGGGPFHQVAPSSGLLLGVHYKLSEWDRQQVVNSLRGVFDGDGGPQDQEQTVAAPEGYAVGGLIVDADKYVNAVQLVFLRVKPDGALDPADSHTSELIGTPTGRPTRTLAGDGTKVIGLHGRKGLIVDSVGLVLARE